MIDLQGIKDRIQTAEYAAVHVCNNSAIWHRYYEDSANSTAFIRDFRLMVDEIEHLRGKMADMEHKLESLGSSVD